MGRKKRKIKENEIPEGELQNLIISLGVDLKERDEIEVATRGQTSNERWFEERKRRITASNFFQASKKPTKERVYELLYPAYRSTEATDWGKGNEDKAIEDYEKLTGESVEKCGLFVCLEADLGYLGASPDGLVGSEKVIEVKCPFSGRNYSPRNIPFHVKRFYCDSIEGRLILKRNHRYYYQVQGQLFVTGRSVCDFVVWTEKGISIETIYFDKEFVCELIPKLKKFFINGYAPEILKSLEEKLANLRVSS